MKNSKTQTGELSSDQLTAGLYAFEDLMERLSSCPFMPLFSTARDINKSPDSKLTGDKLYFGIKKDEWTSARRSMFETLSKHLKFEYTMTDKGFVTEMSNVPIEVIIIKNDYEFFRNPNITFWGATEFLMPNPMNTYLKTASLVR